MIKFILGALFGSAVTPFVVNKVLLSKPYDSELRRWWFDGIEILQKDLNSKKAVLEAERGRS